MSNSAPQSSPTPSQYPVLLTRTSAALPPAHTPILSDVRYCSPPSPAPTPPQTASNRAASLQPRYSPPPSAASPDDPPPANVHLPLAPSPATVPPDTRTPSADCRLTHS